MQVNIILSLLAIVSLATLSHGQFFASCPDVKVQKIEPTKFLGTWYQIAKVESFATLPERNGVCSRAVYTVSDEHPGRIALNNSQRITDPVDGKSKFVLGEAYPEDPSEPGKLTVKINTGLFTATAPLWVLSTDYSQYAMVYTCVKYFHLYRFQTPYILSRTPVLDQKVLSEVIRRYEDIGIDKNTFSYMRQKDCKYDV
ncbi:hypothetical protein AKO1_014616 [Acrasis kona]|uniref:Lipocalin/cytosolic fatty-acid binding domain-containing protein n=1 Tax=Acrasis kona TaxID=1008807 RepID=A0AAW2Z1K1_9EUKA